MRSPRLPFSTFIRRRAPADFSSRGKRQPARNFRPCSPALAGDKASKIGFLFGADDSPTRNSLTKVLATKFAAAKFYQYEALTGEASNTVLGDGVKLVADFAKADRIVSLDCDFVGTDSQGPVTPFFDRRKPEGKAYESAPDKNDMNRLYSVEAAFTLTGGMADHRLRVTPSQVNAVAAQIARGLGVSAAVAAVVPPLTDPNQIEWVAGLVKDLKESGGKSVVLAGSRQSLSVHLIANEINLFLQNIGEGKPLVALQKETKGLGNIGKLKADIDSGAVEVLVMMTPSNPVFDAPADLKIRRVVRQAQDEHSLRHPHRRHRACLHLACSCGTLS